MRRKDADLSQNRPSAPSPEPAEGALLLAPAKPESSLQPTREAESSAPAAPPQRLWRAPRADNWERREGLRATLLLHLPTLREQATYRRIGLILYDAALARGEDGAENPIEFAFRQMESALSEIRFLEGFLGDVADLHALDDEKIFALISRQARAQARRLSRQADAFARQLEATAKLL